MSLPPPDPYGAALGHWISVQKQLADTIQDHLEACTALKTALMTHPTDILSLRLQNKAFADLDYRLPALHTYEESLQGARASLRVTRNNSQSLVPINSLPPEILITVLSLASREWVNQDHITVQQGAPVSVAALASVCSLWRGLMLQSHSLWSRLELVLCGRSSEPHYKRAALWAERSQNVALHVSVQEGDLEPDECVDEWQIRRAIEFLAPLMPRVRGLEIILELSSSNDSVYLLVDCWVQHGSIGTAGLLKIQASGETAVAPPSSYTGTRDKAILLDRFESFFRSVHTLSLGNAIIERSLGIYSGLVDLHLGYIHGGIHEELGPSHSELAAILAASPGLRSLSIVDIGFNIDQGHMPRPVALNNLEFLTLESRYPKNLRVVLQMITSTSGAIRMSLSLENHPDFISAARSFFQRCKVTVLHIGLQFTTPHPPVSPLFTRMPYLEQLAIFSCSLSDTTWGDFFREWSLDNGPLGVWPRLREIYLTRCNSDRNVLQQLVSICAPRTLWVQDNYWPSTNPYGDPEVREQMREDLLKGGVELIWAVSWKEMPTRRWRFVGSYY